MKTAQLIPVLSVAMLVAGAAMLTAGGAEVPAPGAPTARGEAKSREELKKKYLRPNDIPFPAENLYSKDKELPGRTLFFDPRLSGSRSMACSSCHNPG